MGKLELVLRSIRRRGLLNTVRYLSHEVGFDLKYGTDTKPEMADYVLAGQYLDNYRAPCQGANPWIVNQCFDELSRLGVQPEQSAFLDFGSGKGRVMLMALMAGFRRVIGVELDPALCKITSHNLDGNPTLFMRDQCIVCNEDATQYIPPADINVVFLYNPFGCELVRAVMLNLLLSFRASRRPIYVIYVNPVCAQVLIECGLRPVSEIAGEAKIFMIA
ncbi:hypothetical protein CLG94_03070 [Candidatus Methylomirabilis limnetica]|uniref:DOT1 domain-containing protein n=1 Tax=Candidatus Methylomirabilis limnetica TaxID=2033718 RepID=A0A2T4TZX8_9BACT|nr:hypothetical protein [Candidatus Methylomirabilis limnetica]PTL36676.1 hypothetical protein CLG94_03070 [Candidatus Methylomirabilis limnetica]